MQNFTETGTKGVSMCKVDVEGPPRDALHAMDWVPEPWKHARDLPAKSESWEGTFGYFVNTQQLAAHSMVYGLWALSLRVNPLSGRPCILPTSQVKKRFPKH